MGRQSDKRRFVEKNVQSAPASSGVYRLYQGPKVSYVGSSQDMATRLSRHLRNPRFRDVTSFDTMRTPSTDAARSAELRQIKRLKPPQNHT